MEEQFEEKKTNGAHAFAIYLLRRALAPHLCELPTVRPSARVALHATTPPHRRLNATL